jgi:putative peptide maturation system protein
MPSAFEVALIEAVGLVRSLPRNRPQMADAAARFAAFKERHPQTPMRLVVDRPPGSHRIEHDILLEHSEEGTVAVTWRPDDGVPWSIAYADHWASNLVVTVTSGLTASVTVQEALFFLKMSRDKFPDLMEQIVEQQLIAMSIEADPPSVSQAELQDAADTFRSSRGLLKAEAMQRQLQEWGLTPVQFQEMVKQAIEREKLQDAVTERDIEPFFIANRGGFERIQYFRVTVPTARLAESLARHAAEAGLMTAAIALVGDPAAVGVQTEFTSRFARDFPGDLAVALPDVIIGPTRESGTWSLSQVFARQPATLDDETRGAVRQLLYRRWLQQKREGATVEWHWL